MQALMNQVLKKLDKIDDAIANIDRTCAKQEEQIAYHIKRTDLLEAQMEPIKQHVSMVHGALKFVGGIAVLTGVITGLIEIIKLVGSR